MDHLDQLQRHLDSALEDCERGRVDNARSFLIEAIHHARAAANARVLSCVYCGHQYPQDTPAHGDAVLTEHIKVCEKHPLRAAEAKLAKLRSALVTLVGVETPEELRQLDAVMRAVPGADSDDRTACLAAIEALLETAEA